MNKDDFGGFIRLEVSEDISSYTTFTMKIINPKGVEIVKTAILGTSDLETEDGIFLANQYASYQVEADILTEFGLWRARLTVTDATRSRSTKYIGFPIGV